MAFNFRPSRAASKPDHFTCWGDNFGFRLWVGDLFSNPTSLISGSFPVTALAF